MNIIQTQFTLQYKSFDIYIAGCSGEPKCVNCHNKSSWDFNIGYKYDTEYFNKHIKQVVETATNLIDNIMIFGGEPLDQDNNCLETLLTDLNSLNKKIWLFTRYELSEIPNNILYKIDYVKTGRYLEQYSNDNYYQFNLKLSTDNQKIFKLR